MTSRPLRGSRAGKAKKHRSATTTKSLSRGCDCCAIGARLDAMRARRIRRALPIATAMLVTTVNSCFTLDGLQGGAEADAAAPDSAPDNAAPIDAFLADKGAPTDGEAMADQDAVSTLKCAKWDPVDKHPNI